MSKKISLLCGIVHEKMKSELKIDTFTEKKYSIVLKNIQGFVFFINVN